MAEGRLLVVDAVLVDVREAVDRAAAGNRHDHGSAVHAVLLALRVAQPDRHPADAALGQVRDRHFFAVLAERPREPAHTVRYEVRRLPRPALVIEVDGPRVRRRVDRGLSVVGVAAELLVGRRDRRERRRVVDVVRALGVVVAVAESVARLPKHVRAIQMRVALVRADLLGHGVAVVVHEVHAAVPTE